MNTIIQKLPYILFFTIASTLMIQSVKFAYYEFTPRTHFFDYKSVEYVRHDAENSQLVIASNSKYVREGFVTWNDVLRCKDGGKFRFWSSQTTSAQLQARPYFAQSEWNYGAAYPLDRDCFLESSIEMYGKLLKIRTPIFVVQ